MAWGLRRIAWHERLGVRAGRRLSTLIRRRRVARAARRIPALRPWEGMPSGTFARYRRGANAVRVAKVLDLVPPGRRILDIGVGHGYVAGLLLRDRRPPHYCGVDLRKVRIEATRAMIAANDLGDRPVELVVRDILDLDDKFWRDHEPEVVLLLELLEHLGDPEGVLLGIAGAVEPGTTLAFSVPLYGRLEGVWGHRSVFDSARLERLCRRAGLVIDRAEPVHGTWSVVVARTDPWATGEPESGYAFSQVFSPAGDAPPGGGVRLRMTAPRVVRLDLSVERPWAVRQLRIKGLDELGATQIEWAVPAPPHGRATYVLRACKASGAWADRRVELAQVTWIDVSVATDADAACAVRVHRAAYIGSRRVGCAGGVGRGAA